SRGKQILECDYYSNRGSNNCFHSAFGFVLECPSLESKQEIHDSC
ncbi:hypothetical protein Csa_023781, partial [Cucumis sativus]